METQRASVIITTYNGANRGYLSSAIESVLAQTCQDFQLLLVDDGSTDNTPELCRQYLHDARVRYIRQDNAGVAAARNLGIAMAEHRFICFLDDDDEWKPTKLERQLAMFREGSERLGLVYTAIEILNSCGAPIGIQRHEVPDQPYLGLFYENFVDATSSVMVTRAALDKVGAFRAEMFGLGWQGSEDRELWSRIAREFSIAAIPEPLVRYRVHGDKLSRNLEQMERGETRMIRLALADAPPEIRDQSAAIEAHAARRSAMEYFAIGEYALFRDRVRRASSLEHPGFGMRARYALSFVPVFITLARRVLAFSQKAVPR